MISLKASPGVTPCRDHLMTQQALSKVIRSAVQSFMAAAWKLE